MGKYLEFQAFIGPEFLAYGNAALYTYHLAAAMAQDATAALDYETNVGTIFNSGDTSLVTTNNAGLYGAFPTAGGLWVGPNGASQGWEHVSYTGRTTYTFTGLTRESLTYREHNGVHSVGAEVRFWYPIESDNGMFHFTDELEQEFQARHWRFQLGGFTLPHSLLRRNHLVAVVRRTVPGAAWTLFALGITDMAQIRDDFERKGEWVLHANSVHGICEATTIHGVHIGDVNVAPYGQAQSSAPLGSAFKELLSGDYVSAQPDFSAQSAVDDDNDTLWISDYMVGTQVTTDATWHGPTQLYINPHLGRGPAYKWVELTNFSTNSQNLHVYDPDTADDYVLDFDDFAVDSGDYRVILTDDPVTFARENPGHQADLIVDVTGLSFGSDFMKHCNPVGGAMAIYESTGFTRPIMWGNVDVGAVEDFWELSPSQWIGTAIAAPGYGQTIAYDHDHVDVPSEDSKNRWDVLDYGTPGYTPRPDNAYAWWAVYLPGLGLVLRDDVSAGAATIYVVDGAGEPSTEGLPSSGTLQVGSDQFTYTGKQSDRLTGVSGMLAHSAGDTIYVVENGIATDGYPVEFVKLRRFGGTIYPKEFIFRWSRVLARLPNSSDHEEDYNSPYGGYYHPTTGSTADYLMTMASLGDLDPTVRMRTILIEFRKMTTEPACARLNELQAIVDTGHFSIDFFLESPANAGQAIFNFFVAAGIHPGSVSYIGVTVSLQRSFRTARERAWRAVVDFADMCGLFVNVGRDNRIVITDNVFYSTAVSGYAADYTWDEDDVVYVDKVARTVDGVGQFRIEWESPDGNDSGTEVYPSSVGTRGEIVDIGPYIFADAAAAQLSARKRYFLAQAPDYVVVELDDIDLTIQPGEIFNLSWLFPGETSSLNRLYMIVGVDLKVEQNVATQVITGIQIDREVSW